MSGMAVKSKTGKTQSNIIRVHHLAAWHAEARHLIQALVVRQRRTLNVKHSEQTRVARRHGTRLPSCSRDVPPGQALKAGGKMVCAPGVKPASSEGAVAYGEAPHPGGIAAVRRTHRLAR